MTPEAPRPPVARTSSPRRSGGWRASRRSTPSSRRYSSDCARPGKKLRDTATELERYRADIEADPARLEALDERLAQIEALQRKYGGSIEEILRFRSDAATELGQLEGASERAQAIGDLRIRQLEQLTADAERALEGAAQGGQAPGCCGSVRTAGISDARGAFRGRPGGGRGTRGSPLRSGRFRDARVSILGERGW